MYLKYGGGTFLFQPVFTLSFTNFVMRFYAFFKYVYLFNIIIMYSNINIILTLK